METVREPQRLDSIVEAATEIEFWKRQARVRSTKYGRQYAETQRGKWSRRLTELEGRGRQP